MQQAELHSELIDLRNAQDGAAAIKLRPRTVIVRRRDRGAMLLAVLFLMAMMVIAAMAIAPAFVQQMKRDREEEMIHRGTEYARAIKKYYKKFGRYPANLEQLENTNNIRFLRKRFKDPLDKRRPVEAATLRRHSGAGRGWRFWHAGNATRCCRVACKG